MAEASIVAHLVLSGTFMAFEEKSLYSEAMTKRSIAIYNYAAVHSGGDSSSICSLLGRGQPPFTPLHPIDHKALVGRISGLDEDALARYTDSLKLLQRQDRVVRLGCYVAQQTLSALSPTLLTKNRSVFAGTSRGATSTIEESYEKFLSLGKVPVHTSPATTFGCLASSIAQLNDITEDASDFSATCTSGLAALRSGYLAVQSGSSNGSLIVGSEAPLTRFTLAQMEALGVTASNWELPFPCMPLSSFQTSGTGMVLGEGAAAVFLAPLECSSNEMKPKALLSAVESTTEPITSPTGISDQGKGIGRAMELTINAAGGVRPELILAHAPGTRLGDQSELNAIKRLFGMEAPPVYSAKWALGHTFGAAGLLSAALALELLNGAELPKLPYDSEQNEKLPLPGRELNHILINTIGFGGYCSSALLSRFDG
ncbi:MAG: hypothetical protein KDD70_03110 [Bdellovibrionales bacterium]|nr:hypothetical protein [Bdellovibrionales bacterium]